MRTVSGKRWQILLGSCLLLLALVLASCGASTGTGTSTGGNGAVGATAGVGSSPTPVKGYGTGYGCPSDAVVTSTSPAARIIQLKDTNTVITVSNGATIEVQLPFGQKWLGPTSKQGPLVEQQPAGYASKNVNACVWRFVAKATGTAQLEFNGMALCQHSKACPMYIMAVPFTIKVQ